MTSPDWVRRLQHVAWEQNSLRGLNPVLEVIGMAVGCAAVVLWEEAPAPDAASSPSVVAQWPGAAGNGSRSTAPRCDCTTLAAFRTGSLALPPPGAGRHSDGVILALPLKYLDGRPGVLALAGDAELTDPAFDLAADLVDVLPGLCGVLRDRQALALLRDCQRILHKADLESPRDPLSPGRLAVYMSDVCRSVAAVLGCSEVSLHTREHDTGEDGFELLASSSARSGRQPDLIWPAGHAAARAPSPDQPAAPGGAGPLHPREVMACALVSGDQVLGQIRCSGVLAPPFHFTYFDEESLSAVANLVAQHWSNWLHRRTILAENLSWNRLATGITAFNQRISEELSRRVPRDHIIDDIAVKIVLEVVPECGWVDIRQASGEPGDGKFTFDRRAARGTGDPAEVSARAGAPLSALLRTVLRTGAQESSVVDSTDLHPAATRPGPYWFVGTPIGFGGRSDGVLAAFGPSASLPPNSRQVCEIIGDQLALYQHFHLTMTNLRHTQRQLQDTLRSQADTLADLEHQLVSPLLTATSRIERVMRSGRFDSRTDAQLRAVRGLCRKASRVAMSAGVFAALSKDEAPRPKGELMGVDDLLRLLIGCADDAQLLSNPRRHITFDVERRSVRDLGRRLIRNDRSFLEQCVGNLLDNAAKYSYEGTSVNIRGRLDGDRFTVAVANSGLPMSAADIDRCLERNWRGAAASTATGEGSGLGLWIADNLMRSMRGSVHVSADGDRTTVGLTFPLC